MNKKLLIGIIGLAVIFGVSTSIVRAQVANGSITNSLIKLVGTTIEPANPAWMFQGGGGGGSPGGTSGQLQYNGSGNFAGVSTTTLAAGTGVTFTGGTPVIIGSSPITISASGGGSGTVGTSSSETAGEFSYWTTNSATPALLSGTSNLFTSSSNIGIATNTPAYLLAIEGGSSQTPLFLTGTNNGFLEGEVQNRNSGASASSDWVVEANDGTETTHYGDFFINGSGGGAAPFTNAHAVGIYTVDNELDLAATGASGVITFNTTGGTTPVERARFAANGDLGIGTTTPTAPVHVASNGNTGTQINLEDTSGAANARVQSISSVSYGGLNTLNVSSKTDAGATTTEAVFATSTSAQIAVGTTTPYSAAPSLIITKGSSATTTAVLGNIGDSSSKFQMTIQTDAGGVACLYVNATPALVVQSGACTP